MAWIERYVSVSGGGAHDGTTEANAWSFAQMVAATFDTTATSETRINIKSGTYFQGAWTWDAAVALKPIVYRGYYVIPGDLDQAVRGDDGVLVTTNFPIVQATATWIPSTFSFMQNLVIIGPLNGYLVGNGAIDSYGFVNCSFLNTESGANAGCVNGDDYCFFVNCDFSCTGNNHLVIVKSGVSCRAIGCRFHVTNNTASALVCDSGIIYRCVFIGDETGNNFAIETGKVAIANVPITIIGCTIYGYSTAIFIDNFAQTGMPVLVSDNLVTDCDFYLQRNAGGEATVIESNNRTRDNTTPRTLIIPVISGKEVTVDGGGSETDYLSVTTENLRLTQSSPARMAGMMPNTDCGAFQSNGGGTSRSRPLRSGSKSS